MLVKKSNDFHRKKVASASRSSELKDNFVVNMVYEDVAVDFLPAKNS